MVLVCQRGCCSIRHFSRYTVGQRYRIQCRNNHLSLKTLDQFSCIKHYIRNTYQYWSHWQPESWALFFFLCLPLEKKTGESVAKHPTGSHFMTMPKAAHFVILSWHWFTVSPFLAEQKFLLGFAAVSLERKRRSRKKMAKMAGAPIVACIFGFDLWGGRTMKIFLRFKMGWSHIKKKKGTLMNPIWSRGWEWGILKKKQFQGGILSIHYQTKMKRTVHLSKHISFNQRQ